MNGADSDKPDSYPLPAIECSFVAEGTANPIREKSFRFALAMIGVCRSLQSDREFVISKQLMRSGTSIGANVEEAISAESRKDFLHKMNLALKEARESHYWLRLLDASEIEVIGGLHQHLMAGDELIRLLVSITRSLSRS